MSTEYQKSHPLLDRMDFNWLLFRIKNVNLIINKIHPSLGGEGSLRIKNVNLNIVKSILPQAG